MFSKIVRSLRKSKGMTQRDLADALHVSSSAVAMWESGKREPSYETLQQIASYFHVTTDYLIDSQKNYDAFYESLGIQRDPKKEARQQAFLNKLLVSDALSVLEHLPDDKMEQVLQYARFLSQNEQKK